MCYWVIQYMNLRVIVNNMLTFSVNCLHNHILMITEISPDTWYNYHYLNQHNQYAQNTTGEGEHMGGGGLRAGWGFLKGEKIHIKRKTHWRGQEGVVDEGRRELHVCESHQPAGGCGGLRGEGRRRIAGRGEDSQWNCVGCGYL